MTRALWLAPILVCALALVSRLALPQQMPPRPAVVSARTGDFTTSFDGAPLSPQQSGGDISYDLDSGKERFFIHVSPDYTSHDVYGLVVYMDPGDAPDSEPIGWARVLDRRKLLFIAPLAGGNGQDVRRRLGLGVVAASEMMTHYTIDPKRIYAAGFSGGGRMAGRLAFFRPDLFRGTLQSCGVDFYQAVPRVFASDQIKAAYGDYGLFDVTPEQAIQAKQVRFAFITGPGDFRHGNILDIYHGGYEEFGFQARLFDVPGMSHEPADAVTLQAALDFIDPR